MKKIFKTLVAVGIALSLVLGGYSQAALAAEATLPFDTTATSAILLEPDSGEILYAKNIHQSLPPASVTKIMTMLVACEAIDQGKASLKDIVTASEHAASLGGSQIYLEPGEQMSLEELMISIATGSANDSCVAVAEHIAGSHEGFVDLMNNKARQLGLKDSKFVNAYGLPAEGHVTSAYDMAMILKAGLKYPFFQKITSMKEYDLRGGQFKLWNTNKLLWWYRGTFSGKTGWTNEAKYCLASAVDRDGLKLIAVVLGTPEVRSHFRESIKLYNYGFARYRAVNFWRKGDRVDSVRVGKGLESAVGVVAKEAVNAMVVKGQEKDVTFNMKLQRNIDAPVVKGQKLGEVQVYKKGKVCKTVDLVAKNHVQKAGFWEETSRTAGAVWSKLSK